MVHFLCEFPSWDTIISRAPTDGSAKVIFLVPGTRILLLHKYQSFGSEWIRFQIQPFLYPIPSLNFFKIIFHFTATAELLIWIWCQLDIILVLRQNVPKKRPKTKRPTDKISQGQNIPRDKTSQGTKRPTDKISHGKNLPRDKTSQWTNEAHYLTCVANYLIKYGQDKGMT